MATPLTMDEMTDDQFDDQTFALIAREFGVGGLARFIRLHRSGRGDHTTDRHQWLDGLRVEDILHELDAERPQ